MKDTIFNKGVRGRAGRRRVIYDTEEIEDETCLRNVNGVESG